MGDNHAAEVQAELQHYLSSKNINSLFIQIVESLLIEKPDNPIAFMVEYLLKSFPSETRDFQRTMEKGEDGTVSAAAAHSLSSAANMNTNTPNATAAPIAEKKQSGERAEEEEADVVSEEEAAVRVGGHESEAHKEEGVVSALAAE